MSGRVGECVRESESVSVSVRERVCVSACVCVCNIKNEILERSIRVNAGT